MNRPLDRSILISATALAAAVLLCGFTLARAIAVRPTAAVTPQDAPIVSPAEAPEAAPENTMGATVTAAALRQTVDNDPFQADRHPPPQRYRMPGEEEAPVAEAPPAPKPPPFKLLGTVSGSDQSLALLQVEDSPPQPVGLGETLQGYRLEAVGSSYVTMVGDGQTVQLALAPPSPNPSAAARSGRGGRNGNANEEFRAAIQRMIQQRGSGGVVPQMLQFLQGRQGNRSNNRSRTTNDRRGRGNDSIPAPARDDLRERDGAR